MALSDARARHARSAAAREAVPSILDPADAYDHGDELPRAQQSAHVGASLRHHLREWSFSKRSPDHCNGRDAQPNWRGDRVIGRIRAPSGDVLLFAHRDILRVVAARWLGMTTREGRCRCGGILSEASQRSSHDCEEFATAF